MVLSSRTAALGTENAFALLRHIDECRRRGLDVVMLNLGEPDFDTPGFVADAAVAAIRNGNTHYCDPSGLVPLRTAIAGHIGASRGLAVPADRVVVTPGAKPTIGYTFQAYVEPGDEVIYPSPGFPIYESWAAYVGARPVPLALDEERGFTADGDDLQRLLSPATKLVILNSPSNPTGGVFSPQQVAELADAIQEGGHPDMRVYSDEVYEHLLFDGATHHSIASEPGMADRCIIAGGHSKGFAMTGWRLGFAVLPTVAEARFFEQLNINLVSCVPPFVQDAGAAALTDPRAEPAVAAMVAELEARRDWIVAALNAIPGVTCRVPGGAFYVFPNVAGMCRSLGVRNALASLPPDEAAQWLPATLLQMFLLYRHGVATMDRASFGRIGAEAEDYLRLSFAAGIDELRRGVERIAAAATDTTGFASFMSAEKALIAAGPAPPVRSSSQAD